MISGFLCGSSPTGCFFCCGFGFGAAVGGGAEGADVSAVSSGGLIGAGAITVHLLMDHPQANLEAGSVLLFTLSNRLTLVAPNATGN